MNRGRGREFAKVDIGVIGYNLAMQIKFDSNRFSSLAGLHSYQRLI